MDVEDASNVKIPRVNGLLSSISKTMEDQEDDQPAVGLCNLSNDVLAFIFSSINTEVIAGTYSLSKGWKDLWTISPCVDLDEVPFHSYHRHNEEEDASVAIMITRKTRRHLQRRRKVEGIMNRYMQLHKDCMNTFKLQFTTNDVFNPKVDSWIKYATSRRAQVLDIDLRFPRWEVDDVHQYRFSPSLVSGGSSSSSALRILKLRGCIVEAPLLSLIGNLKQVVLDDVQASADVIISFFPRCESVSLKSIVLIDRRTGRNDQNKRIEANALKKLAIVSCPTGLLDGYQIYAPELQRLKFDGERVNFSLEGVTRSLKVARVMVDADDGIDRNLLMTLGEISMVERLELGFRNSSGRSFSHATENLKARIALNSPFWFLRELMIIANQPNDGRFKFIVDFVRGRSPLLSDYSELPPVALPIKNREERWQRFLRRENM